MYNVFDNISRAVSMELATPNNYKIWNPTVDYNVFRGGKTADLSITNTFGGILLAADSPGLISGGSVSHNYFTNTNTDNAAGGFNITVERAGSKGIVLIGNRHRNYNQWGEIFGIDASGITSIGAVFSNDNATQYTARGMLIGNTSDVKNITAVAPQFIGQMAQDLNVNPSAGHDNIFVLFPVPSGYSADGISWTNTDKVTVVGPYGNPNFWMRLFANGSDNTTHLWSSGAGGIMTRTTNAAGGLYNRFSISAGANMVNYDYANGNVRVLDGALDILTGGSTTISTGVGSVKMSTANAATNTVWIPIKYNGTTYYVPGFTTNAP